MTPCGRREGGSLRVAEEDVTLRRTRCPPLFIARLPKSDSRCDSTLFSGSSGSGPSDPSPAGTGSARPELPAKIPLLITASLVASLAQGGTEEPVEPPDCRAGTAQGCPLPSTRNHGSPRCRRLCHAVGDAASGQPWQRHHVTCSIGVLGYPAAPAPVDRGVDAGEPVMLRVKRNGCTAIGHRQVLTGRWPLSVPSARADCVACFYLGKSSPVPCRIGPPHTSIPGTWPLWEG